MSSTTFSYYLRHSVDSLEILEAFELDFVVLEGLVADVSRGEVTRELV
jgi:hypothetical protein